MIYGPKASGAWGSGTSYLQGQDGQDGQDGQGITDGDKGDVVVSNTGTVWTVDNNAITNAKILDDTIAESKLDIHGGGPSGTNKFLGYTANGMEWAVPPDTQYSVGDNGLTKNNFTDALKTKLDAIETSATADQTGAEIKTAYEAESNTNAFTDTEKSKLAAIEASATADQTGAEIKTAYEAESDTNALTDALKTKLEGVEASATADQTGAEIKSAYEGESNTNAFTDAEKTKLSGVAASANNYAISADLLDEDNMSTNSATKVPSQQSVKAYVDANSSDTQYTAGTGLQLSGTQFSVTSLALTTVQEASSQSAQLALTTQEGDIVVRTDENKTYCKNSGTAGTMADFTLLRTPTDAVTSINSQTGAITANQIAAAVEAASDSNTFTDADHSKLNAIEASATADQTGAEIKTAYEAESDTNAYTDAEKSKLAAIEASATGDQTNAEIRAAVEAATDSNVFTDADHNKLDGISASANNYSISSDLLDEDNMASNSSSKVASQQSIKAYVDANTGTTDLSYTASSRELASSTGVNVTLPEATTSNAGLQSSSDKSKLDGIASGAEVNVNGDWNSNSGDSEILNKPTIPTNNNQLSNGAGYTTNTGTVTGVSASGSITSTGGTSPTIGIDAATTSAAGSMSSSDKSKLDGIAAGATNTAVPYYTSAISVGDGGLTQKNFTTTLKTKLDGISTGAEANVNADWNSGSGSSQILNKPTLFSGSYNDLSNKPTIPTNNNQLTNGSNYVTSSIISSLDAGNLSSGKVPIGRLGSSGTASSSTFLAGDNSWQTISTGLPSGGTFTADVTFTGTSSKNCVWDVSDSAFEFAQAAQIKLGGHSFQENAYGYLVLDNHSTGNGAYFKFNNQINLNSAIIKFENYGGNQDIFKATTGSIISYAGGTEKFKVDTTGIVVSGGISEEITTITSSSNAATLDQDTATNFVHDLTENVTYTFTNGGVAGTVRSFTLKIIQDSSARTITWPASVDWAGGTAPTLSTGNNDVDVFVFITYDGGSTYYGFTAGQDLS